MFHFDRHPEYAVPGVMIAKDKEEEEAQIREAAEEKNWTGDHQICVIQTTTGDEKTVLKLIDAIVRRELVLEKFMPQREVQRKRYGKWKVIKERLFPGYLFITTGDVVALFFELKRVPYLTKILGDTDANFIVLSEKEQRFLERIGGKRGDHTFRISKVQIESDMPYKKGDRVRILSGDLAAFEGEVVGFDFHHRKAMIQTDLFGGVVMHVGIELAEKISG